MSTSATSGTDYYIDSGTGKDAWDGRSPERAWRSLEPASSRRWGPGDRLLLRRGRVYRGKLRITGGGRADQPLRIDAYGADAADSASPVVDGSGYLAAIHLDNASHVVIGHLELTADGQTPCEESGRHHCFGVLISASSPGLYEGIRLEHLFIHDIFACESMKDEGANPTSNRGMGIGVRVENPAARLRGLQIENCVIQTTGHTGIRINGLPPNQVENIQILRNRLRYIGGPGMVPAGCRQVLVRGNDVQHTGASIDPRMHMRGSGIWPVRSDHVLIERNRFMHARGKADSCGVHIDHDCSDVIVQYNLSHDNEGGFAEILGNGKNNAYRYNISVDDGFRVKGKNGAIQHGKVIWASGYTGAQQPKQGPTYTYIYNNTIVLRQDRRTNFSIASTTQGLLVANNIFHLYGPAGDVSDDQDDGPYPPGLAARQVRFCGNLFLEESTLPASLPLARRQDSFGDANFPFLQGKWPEDFYPGDQSLVQSRGVVIEKLTGDERGLSLGLEVTEDFFGKAVGHPPSLGAIEP